MNVRTARLLGSTLLGLCLITACADDNRIDGSRLKIYEGIENIEERAERYRADGLRWFQPVEPWKRLDENGIPIVRYRWGDLRNPVTTSQTAFAFYGRFLDGRSADARQSFLNNVNWLVQNRDAESYLRYGFPWRHHDHDFAPQWVSAMAQGEALAAVCMAHHLTGENRYLVVAGEIFETLAGNTDSTWCVSADADGYYWLEEYPNPDSCHVLNGFLFGLWGLWSYYAVSDDESALTFFLAGIRTVSDHYRIWNVPNDDLSRYCLHDEIGSKVYHEVHLKQLKAYDGFFEIPEFRDAVELFSEGRTTGSDD